ncbi:MAG: competence/damage-inducible protein A [Ignavibacteriota bacterium]|nr:competence/damage-inducible protein A [Ignavibacteriales bacterium]MBL1121500.1 competence/damage-inducible protein A [Ignavibacteriota bacterium]MCC7095520.1 competence/damage-inducible protein A [Ignavibacteriaceae bacterium]MCE7855776.1 competence/damage-inducible protein A [Ignavibacteria bacterium CHB3]MEB2295397.1 competence/damage-inducible protein A [Ignavibacteria bacterium]
MKAYIITIGDEILLGSTLNTNAAFIGTQLFDINIPVVKTSVIGDDNLSILNEIKSASEVADLILITGGLGPTHDDVTRKSIVDFFKTELVDNNEVLEDIKALFDKRKRKLSPANIDQAKIPIIADAIRNSHGTAPGEWIEQDGKIYVVMPGVPYEMESMMQSYVIPKLHEKIGQDQSIILRKMILTTGIPESTLYERFGNLDELLNGGKLAFLPNQYGVKLRISVEGTDEKELQNKMMEIEQRIRSKAGRFIYGVGDEQLEAVVGRLLIEREFKIATAESCTGGLVGNMLTNVSGSSKYFERGVICYSNAAKVEILKVNEDTLAEHGAVSMEVAMQMAEGIKSTSGADIGLATTGIMGPTGASTNKPVGLVFIGYCDDKVCTAKKFQFGEERLLNKERTAQAALDFVRRKLLGISSDD